MAAESLLTPLILLAAASALTGRRLWGQRSFAGAAGRSALLLISALIAWLIGASFGLFDTVSGWLAGAALPPLIGGLSRRAWRALDWRPGPDTELEAPGAWSLRAWGFAPGLLIIALISALAYNAPRIDEWDTPGQFLERAESQGFPIGDLLEQHMESRKALSRLVYGLMNEISCWRPVAGMLLNAGAQLVALAALLALMPLDRRRPGASRLAALTLGALLFSPLRAPHFFSGLGINGGVVFLSLSLGLLAISRDRAPIRAGAWAAGLSAVASLSFASGLLLWIIFAIGLLSRRLTTPEDRPAQRWTALLAYFCAGALFFWLYFSGYQRPPGQPSWMSSLSAPGASVKFALSWLGAPLSGGNALAAMLMGLLLVTLAGALTAAVIRACRGPQAQANRRALAPWMLLLSYPIGASLLVAMGRSGLHPRAALADRYLAHSMMAPIALFGLAWTLRQHQAKDSRFDRWTIRIALSALGAFAVFGWLASVGFIDRHHRRQKQNFLTLQTIDQLPENPMFEQLHPGPLKALTRRARFLRKRGVLPFGALDQSIAESLRDRRQKSAGALRIRSSGRGWSIKGWALEPDTHGALDWIVLTAGRGANERVITVLIPTKHLLTGALRGWNPRGLRCGVRVQFQRPPPVPLGQLRAFAVDLRRQRAWPLSIVDRLPKP